MNKDTLNEAVNLCKETTRQALQTIYDALNHGQQIQIVKDQNAKALFELFEVKI